MNNTDEKRDWRSKGNAQGNKGKSGGKDADASKSGGKGKGKGGGKHNWSASRSSELPHELETLSRELVQLLRHKGLEEQRADGFAPLAAVVAALRSKPSIDQVEAVVLLSKRDGVARFESLDENGARFLRARDKRSLPTAAQQKPNSEAKSDTSKPVRQDPQQSNPRPSKANEFEESGYALHDFDAAEWGDEYISLHQGDSLILRRDYLEDGGWAFGRTSEAEGWFPATLWSSSKVQTASQCSAGQYMEMTETPSREDSRTQECQDTAVGSPTHVIEELAHARAQIERLQAELKRERSISASLRQELAAAKGFGTSGVEASPQSSGGAVLDEFPTLGKSTLQSKPIQGRKSDKQLLQDHLSETLPNIRNEGITYEITERSKDAQGRTLFRASVQIKELGDRFTGDHRTSQKEAEQSAAYTALRELGGLNLNNAASTRSTA